MEVEGLLRNLKKLDVSIILFSETLLDNNIKPNFFLRIGLGSDFSSIVGTQKYLRKTYKIDSKSIFFKVKKLLNKNK